MATEGNELWTCLNTQSLLGSGNFGQTFPDRREEFCSSWLSLTHADGKSREQGKSQGLAHSTILRSVTRRFTGGTKGTKNGTKTGADFVSSLCFLNSTPVMFIFLIQVTT